MLNKPAVELVEAPALAVSASFYYSLTVEHMPRSPQKENIWNTGVIIDIRSIRTKK